MSFSYPKMKLLDGNFQHGICGVGRVIILLELLVTLGDCLRLQSTFQMFLFSSFVHKL